MLLIAEPPSVCSLAGDSSLRSSCWDIPVCFFAGAFCKFSFSSEKSFFRALFHKSSVPAIFPGHIFLGLYCRGFCRARFAGHFPEKSFAKGFSRLLFHRVFLHALFCWDIPVCFFAGAFCMFAFSLLGGFSLLSFATVYFCALSCRGYSLALDCRRFFQLLFCFLRGLFSWSFPRWVLSLLLFANMSSVICFPGAFSLQTLQWVFNVLSVATTFSVLSFVGVFP